MTPPCVGSNLLGGDDYDGVCLPECLKLPLEFTLDDSPCPRGSLAHRVKPTHGSAYCSRV